MADSVNTFRQANGHKIAAIIESIGRELVVVGIECFVMTMLIVYNTCLAKIQMCKLCHLGTQKLKVVAVDSATNGQTGD